MQYLEMRTLVHALVEQRPYIQMSRKDYKFVVGGDDFVVADISQNEQEELDVADGDDSEDVAVGMISQNISENSAKLIRNFIDTFHQNVAVSVIEKVNNLGNGAGVSGGIIAWVGDGLIPGC